ncbi:MAG: hypothetical protein KDK44_06515, partial [Chlamydiia bacterium]|nr:hypothetical protein [Chlamydiia bacterium]
MDKIDLLAILLLATITGCTPKSTQTTHDTNPSYKLESDDTLEKGSPDSTALCQTKCDEVNPDLCQQLFKDFEICNKDPQQTNCTSFIQ